MCNAVWPCGLLEGDCSPWDRVVVSVMTITLVVVKAKLLPQCLTDSECQGPLRNKVKCSCCHFSHDLGLNNLCSHDTNDSSNSAVSTNET